MAKEIGLAQDLIPVGRFKAQAGSLLKAVAEDGRTLVITSNGTAAAVVMSPAEYDELRYRQRFVEEIARSLAEADDGKTMTTSQLRKRLRERRRQASSK